MFKNMDRLMRDHHPCDVYAIKKQDISKEVEVGDGVDVCRFGVHPLVQRGTPFFLPCCPAKRVVDIYCRPSAITENYDTDTVSPSPPAPFSLPCSPANSVVDIFCSASTSNYDTGMSDTVSPSPPAPFSLPCSPEGSVVDLHSSASSVNVNTDILDVADDDTGTTTSDNDSDDIDAAVEDYILGKYCPKPPAPFPEQSSPSVATSSASSLKVYITMFRILQRGERKPRKSFRQRMADRITSLFCCLKGQM